MRSIFKIAVLISLLTSFGSSTFASDWIDSSCWQDGNIRTCQRFGIGLIKKMGI